MKAETKANICAHCDKPAEGNHSIHRDGFGVGPEVPLCDACGSHGLPSCPDIWDVIARPSDHQWAHKPMRGQAGDRCEAGNDCGRLGCPECQQ